jgi:hypothetical protein
MISQADVAEFMKHEYPNALSIDIQRMDEGLFAVEIWQDNSTRECFFVADEQLRGLEY